MFDSLKPEHPRDNVLQDLSWESKKELEGKGSVSFHAGREQISVTSNDVRYNFFKERDRTQGNKFVWRMFVTHKEKPSTAYDVQKPADEEYLENLIHDKSEFHPKGVPDILDEHGRTGTLEVRETGDGETGRGLFARESLQTGQRAFLFDGEVVSERHSSMSALFSEHENSVVVGSYQETFTYRKPPLGGGWLSKPEEFGPEEIRSQTRYVWSAPNDDSPLRYLNHSCEPNVARDAENPFIFYALKDIPEGEQIVADYSFLETSPAWEMQCSCGSKDCRKKIGGIATVPLSRLAKHWSEIPHAMREFALKSSQAVEMKQLREKYEMKDLIEKFPEIYLKK